MGEEFGIVTAVVAARGFAFLRGHNDQSDRFFLSRDLLDGSLDRLAAGEQVAFTPITTDRGLRAVAVRRSVA